MKELILGLLIGVIACSSAFVAAILAYELFFKSGDYFTGFVFLILYTAGLALILNTDWTYYKRRMK
jgi:cytochrome c biogenesis protein CcdA